MDVSLLSKFGKLTINGVLAYYDVNSVEEVVSLSDK